MLDQNDQKIIQETMEGVLEKASKKTETKIFKTIEKASKNTETKIIEAVGVMVEQNILPQFDSIRTEMSKMVTKDYLDDKLVDLRGDLVILTRKEDTKLRELVSVLREKNILADPDVKRILPLEPFPQLFLR